MLTRFHGSGAQINPIFVLLRLPPRLPMNVRGEHVQQSESAIILCLNHASSFFSSRIPLPPPLVLWCFVAVVGDDLQQVSREVPRPVVGQRCPNSVLSRTNLLDSRLKLGYHSH